MLKIIVYINSMVHTIIVYIPSFSLYTFDVYITYTLSLYTVDVQITYSLK